MKTYLYILYILNLAMHYLGCSVLSCARTDVASADELQLLEGARRRRGCSDLGTTEQSSQRQQHFEAVLVEVVIAGERKDVQSLHGLGIIL